MFLPCSLLSALSGDDLHGGAACALTDHRAEILAAFVLCLVGSVDQFIDRALDRLERHFLRDTGGRDSPPLLSHRGLMPARVCAVVRAHIERAIDGDGPNPCRSAVCLAVLTQRRNM